MLPAQFLIGSKQNDIVYFPLLPILFCIVEELLDVDMHLQSLARTGSLPKGELVQRILSKIGHTFPDSNSLVEVGVKEVVQIIGKGFLVTEVTVKIDFREK